MRISIPSRILVGLQFLLIGYLLATGPWFPAGWYWLLPYAAGWMLALMAFVAFRNSRLTVFPEPRQGATLLTTGVFRYIRHPFYAAVLLIMLSLTGNAFTLDRMGAFLVLLIILVIKLNFEERLLEQTYPQYKAYARRSWRLIPWVY